MNGTALMEATGNSTTSTLSSVPFKRLARKTIASTLRFSKGVDAHYVQINEHWGFKFYDCKKKATTCFFRQCVVLYLTGLAPNLGTHILRVKIPAKQRSRWNKSMYGNPLPKIGYGFFVEHCQTPEWDNMVRVFRDNLAEELDKTFPRGTIMIDTTYGNVGYNHAGKLVPIDFGCWAEEKDDPLNGWLRDIPQLAQTWES